MTELSQLKKYLPAVGLPSGYTVDTDNAKGSEISGFDQLTISWQDNDMSKSIQIFPEISDDMHIKRWTVVIYAWKDVAEGRLFWSDKLITKKRKADMIGVALVEIANGMKKLNMVSLQDLKITRH